VSASEQPSTPSEELSALVVGVASQLERANAQTADLAARLGRDSTNSFVPAEEFA
jgi:hypothetical protein